MRMWTRFSGREMTCVLPALDLHKKRSLSTLARALAVFSLALTGANVAWSQATGTILGTVFDPAQAMIAGATVTVTNVDTNVSRTTMTNSSGFYQVSDLIPGQYTVAAEMTGFKRAVQRQFELQVAQSARVELRLEVGDTKQSVEVSAAAILLNTTDATVGHVIGIHETRELPLNGRNYLQLATLVPGTSVVGSR